MASDHKVATIWQQSNHTVAIMSQQSLTQTYLGRNKVTIMSQQCIQQVATK